MDRVGPFRALPAMSLSGTPCLRSSCGDSWVTGRTRPLVSSLVARTGSSPLLRIERSVVVDKLPEALTAEERATQVGLIEDEEAARPTGAPVAGFDLTFSVPKSVSTLWAVADGGTQALIAQAHHAAIQEVIELLERDVAATRVGAEGSAGCGRASAGAGCDCGGV